MYLILFRRWCRPEFLRLIEAHPCDRNRAIDFPNSEAVHWDLESFAGGATRRWLPSTDWFADSLCYDLRFRPSYCYRQLVSDWEIGWTALIHFLVAGETTGPERHPSNCLMVTHRTDRIGSCSFSSLLHQPLRRWNVTCTAGGHLTPNLTA